MRLADESESGGPDSAESASGRPAREAWLEQAPQAGRFAFGGPDESTGIVPRRGRLGRLRHAFAFGLTDGEAALVAAAGFFVRGGIVPLVLPAVVLPSVLDIAGHVGVSAISISGRPTMLFIAVVIALALAFVAWLAVANLLGAWLDVWLVRWAVESSTQAPAERVKPHADLLVRMFAIRFVCLAPLAIALVWTGAQIYTSASNELLTPTNLAVPLPIRVIEGAWGAVVVLCVAWLLTETLGAVAVRREILAGRGVVDSIWEAIVEMIRRPVSTAMTFAASTAASLAAMAIALFGTATTFDWVRIAARNTDPIAFSMPFGPFATPRDVRPVVFVAAVAALATAWAISLALAGIASAWRSAAWTNEVTDALSGQKELGLSGGGRK
jgi:hypothetical protein